MDGKLSICLSEWLNHGLITQTQYNEISEYERTIRSKYSLHKSHDHWTTYHKLLEDERNAYQLKNIYDEHRRTDKSDV